MSLVTKFKKHLSTGSLIAPGDTVYVACSGGPDSVALFRLLRQLAPEWKLRLGLIHVHHSLRGKSADRDAEFVRRLAAKYKVPFVLGKKKVRQMARKEKFSIEEAAREARLEFFQETAKKRRIRKIALAHTQDDQAETVLMRILKGTGMRGLSGIRQQLVFGKLKLVRPMLQLTKKEILDWLAEEKISFREDASNRSVKFVRNRVRNKLLPLLEKEFNPRMKEALARIPEIINQENEMLADLESAAWSRVYLKKGKKAIQLDREAFSRFPAPLQFRLLNRALKQIDSKSGISFDRWQELSPQLERRDFRWSLQRDIDLSLSPLQMKLYKK